MSNKIMHEAASPGPVPGREGKSIGQQKRETFLKNIDADSVGREERLLAGEADHLVEYPIARRKAGTEDALTAAAGWTGPQAVRGGIKYPATPGFDSPAESDADVIRSMLSEAHGVDLGQLIVDPRSILTGSVPYTGDGAAVGEPEVRSVSSTGAEKGVKASRFSLIPPGPLKELAEHYGVGAEKYDEHNWAKGYEWSKSIDSLTRHLNAFQSGEDRDPETGSKHMTAVAWHAFTLMAFMDIHPGFDDRLSTLMKEARDGK